MEHEYHQLLVPIQLKATSYQYESPAGILPDSLNKRGEECCPGPVLQPCTVITVNSSTSPVTKATLSDIVVTYQAINDVWKAEDFLQCIFIQSTDESSVGKSSFADFLISNQITHAFVPTTFDINGMVYPRRPASFQQLPIVALRMVLMSLRCLPVNARVSACRQSMRSTRTIMKPSWKDHTKRIQNRTPIYLSTSQYLGRGYQASSLLRGFHQQL